MKKYLVLFSLFSLFSCYNFGQLKTLADLPIVLEEVSGNETFPNSDVIWMANDGGNQPKLFAISFDGKILNEVLINADNNDWEDLTTDDEGNMYIGDFGNNDSKRKNLRILKIDKKYLDKESADVEITNFSYENQENFPPKKDELFFDAESFFYFKNNFYVFTKSRVKKEYGKTFLYKIPAKPGNYTAKLIGEYENCKHKICWFTSVDISPDKTKIALLSQKNILIFSDFKDDDFLSGNLKTLRLPIIISQKEGISFKDENTLLITDEKTGVIGGNLYEFKIK